MFPRILVRITEWVKAFKQFFLEFEERAFQTCVFLRTWFKEDIYRVVVGVIDDYYGDASSNLDIHGQVLRVIGSGTSLVSISGKSETFIDFYKEYLGSGYRKGLLDSPNFDVRSVKRCLKKNCFHSFWDTRPFFENEIHRYTCKGCRASRLDAIPVVSSNGDRDRWHSIAGKRRSCEQHHWDVAAHSLVFEGSWKKDSGNSLVLWLFILTFNACWSMFIFFPMFRKKGKDGYFCNNQLGRMKVRLFHLIPETC